MAITKEQRRLRIRRGIRNKVSGTPERPRLSVFKSNKGIYVQLIDDTTGNTLMAASSQELGKKIVNIEISKEVGKKIAEKAGDKFATVELPYGLEGQVFTKNLKKEDGAQAAEGETLEFMVLEFSKDDKRIVLSHTSVWDKDAEQPRAASPKKSAPKGKKGNTLDKINQEVEKSTLGDLDALSALKDKMEDAGKETAKKASKAKAKKDEEEEK